MARLYGHLGPMLWRFWEQGQEGKSPHLSSLCQLLLILKTHASTTSFRKPSCCGTVDQCPSLHSDCLLRVRHGETTSLSLPGPRILPGTQKAPLPCTPCAALWQPRAPVPSPPGPSSTSPGRGAQGLCCVPEWTWVGVMLGRWGVGWGPRQMETQTKTSLRGVMAAVLTMY